jgi:hypothetical protein
MFCCLYQDAFARCIREGIEHFTFHIDIGSVSTCERQTILHMRQCGKILKRELRKEDKKTLEMTTDFIHNLLDEKVQSAESDESSIDSASVNCVEPTTKVDSEERSVEDMPQVTHIDTIVDEELPQSSLGNLVGVLVFLYILCAMIIDSLK